VVIVDPDISYIAPGVNSDFDAGKPKCSCGHGLLAIMRGKQKFDATEFSNCYGTHEMKGIQRFDDCRHCLGSLCLLKTTSAIELLDLHPRRC